MKTKKNQKITKMTSDPTDAGYMIMDDEQIITTKLVDFLAKSFKLKDEYRAEIIELTETIDERNRFIVLYCFRRYMECSQPDEHEKVTDSDSLMLRLAVFWQEFLATAVQLAYCDKILETRVKIISDLKEK